MKRVALLLAGLAIVATTSVVALSPGESLVRSRVDGSGAQVFTATDGTECWRRGDWVIRPRSVPLAACTAPVATTTSTVPAMTSTTTPPTTTPPETTQPVTTTTAPPVSGGFVETFDGNTGFDRFDWGIYHRDEVNIDQWPGALTWPGDHDLACGDPSTQRTIHRDVKAESFYLCRDHLMTAIGDTAGYSTGWFTPRQTFTTERTVSWDVNVTDLGGRQWFEVSIVPASYRSGVATCPQCSAMDWIAPVAGLPAYPAGSIVVGNGPGGGDIKVSTNGVDRNVKQHYKVAHLDPVGAGSKAIRRPFSIVDNGNGTVTVNFGGFDVFTVPGAFPAGGFNVIFKDHNYTPDKDGPVAGYTWHWDNVVIE